MKKLMATASVLALAALLSGCDVGGSQTKSPLVGTWVFRDGPLTTTYRFNEDGTCSKSVSVPNSVPESERPGIEKGTWSVESGGDLLDIAFSNGSPDPVEESHRITVNERTLVFADQGWNPTFVRQQ